MPAARSTGNRLVAQTLCRRYSFAMSTVAELEKLALELTEKDRAVLAANILETLPPILVDEDEGIAEALRRDAEMDADPSLRMSLADLKAAIRERRR